MSTGPIEKKVKGATFAAAVAGAVIWALNTYVIKAGTPDEIKVLLYLGIPSLLALIGGFVPHHTHRTDPDAMRGRTSTGA